MTKHKFTSLDAYLEGPPRRTQQELAARLGITQSALSMIKSGRRIPRPELALKIHSVTGVPLEVLLQRREGAVA